MISIYRHTCIHDTALTVTVYVGTYSLSIIEASQRQEATAAPQSSLESVVSRERPQLELSEALLSAELLFRA